jgi:hypothetical protein
MDLRGAGDAFGRWAHRWFGEEVTDRIDDVVMGAYNALATFTDGWEGPFGDIDGPVADSEGEPEPVQTYPQSIPTMLDFIQRRHPSVSVRLYVANLMEGSIMPGEEARGTIENWYAQALRDREYAPKD